MRDLVMAFSVWLREKRLDAAVVRVARGSRREKDVRQYVKAMRPALLSGPSYGKSDDDIVREIMDLD